MSSTSEIFNEVKETVRWFSFKQERIILSGKGGSLIGIRGFGGRWPENTAKHLAKNNYRGVLMDLGLQTGGVDSYLEAVKKEVKTYSNSVILGFSMGGIIALRYAQLYGWENIQKIVTIGTPFNGVEMFRRLDKLGGAYKDLSPQSLLLRQLRRYKVPPYKLLNVFAKFDQFVGDHNSFDVPGEKTEVNIAGHNSLMNGTSWISNLGF